MPKGLFLIPSGPKNLNVIFPMIDFSNVTEYFLEVLDDSGDVVATTPTFAASCCCLPDKVRIHFLNYGGTYDAINFNPPKIIHQPTSSEYQRPLKYPLEKTASGIERFNVRANDLYECRTSCYGERHTDWISELYDSPKAFIEWKGTQGQPDSFLPIKIEDAKFEKRKEEERYVYEFVVQFKLSNEKVILRN